MISRALLGAFAVAILSLCLAAAAVAAPGLVEPVQVQRGQAIYDVTAGVAPDGSGEVAFGEKLSETSAPRLAAVARGVDGSYGPLQQLSRTANAEGPPSLLFGAGNSLFAAWGIATNGATAEWARRSPSGLFGAAGELVSCGRFVSYATLSNGSIGVACYSEQGAAPNNDFVYFGELSPTAEFFGAGTNLSGSGIDDNFLVPQTAVGADGTLAVGWMQKDATTGKGKVQVRVRPAGAAAFEPVKTLVEATAPDEDELDDVAVLPDGTVLALVSRDPGLELYTRPPGTATTWSGPQPLLSDDAFGLLAVGPGGGLTLAVTHDNGLLGEPRQIEVATRPPGGSFGAFTPIASGDVFARNLETAPDGTSFLAWGDYGGTSPTLNGALAPPGGSFGPPMTIGTTNGYFSTALTDAGNVLAAWGEEVAPSDERLMVGGIDAGAPPTFGSVDVPATALAGAPVTLSASATDWSGIREIRWELPGGVTLAGASVSHALPAAGTATVRVTAVDRAGNSATTTRDVRVVDEAKPSAPAPDRAKPKLKLKASGKMKLAAFLRGVKAGVSVDEPSRVEVELLARARSAHVFAAQNLILASRQLNGVSGSRVVRLRPNRKLLGGATHFRVALRVTAVDASGNESVQQRSIRVG